MQVSYNTINEPKDIRILTKNILLNFKAVSSELHSSGTNRL